mmetsp:Transcript_32205/g.52038  ORF Transcript_32205/g.52038 Transcript_32205/m.52038 type:complete len:618 (-) Transcript_32205:1026-2879(-)
MTTARSRNRIFAEDVVCPVGKPNVRGLVIKAADDDDLSDDDDESGDDVLPNHAVVCWSKDKDTKDEAIDTLEVIDRAFMHGDVVTRGSDPQGQMGTVVDVAISVDLRFLTGKGPNRREIPNVPSTRLTHIRSLRPGHYVVHNYWLGRIDQCVDNVVVQFDDGSQCRVLHATVNRLIPMDESIDEDSPYFPAQRVRASSLRVFKEARWLKGSFKGRMDGTVVSVSVAEVTVEWLFAASGQGGSQAPHELVKDPSKLVPLNYFSPTWWQLGDHALLDTDLCNVPETTDEGSTSNADEGGRTETTAAEEPAEGEEAASSDVTGTDDQSSSQPSQAQRQRDQSSSSSGLRKRRKKQSQQQRRKRNMTSHKQRLSYADRCAEITCTHSLVTVKWQDGTLQSLNSIELLPAMHLGAHDFWPDEFVLEKVDEHDDGLPNQLQTKGTNETGATVAFNPRPPNAVDQSVPKDPVPRPVTGPSHRTAVVQSVNAKERTCVVRWLSCSKDGTVNPGTLEDKSNVETLSVYDLMDHTDYNFRLGDVVVRLTPKPNEERTTTSTLKQQRRRPLRGTAVAKNRTNDVPEGDEQDGSSEEEEEQQEQDDDDDEEEEEEEHQLMVGLKGGPKG